MSQTPPEKSSDEPRQFLTDSRSGEDRREWHERRTGDPGSGSSPAEREHRSSGSDRRVVLTDRRHATSEPYSHHDAEQIRDMILKPVGVACPQCGGDLLLGQLVSRHDVTGRQIHCVTCRRSVLIAALPEELSRNSTMSQGGP